ncbi:ABC transporter substrate-binding protein [Aneurinibacillus thermoaerophilus]|uniref:Helical backbone metal receptor n=1 Tax=Aneurinibacillus thermoaerophilus TaxID=143495 RepID=A0ABX8YFR2_ANETH|nr:helical backbone metal receptor [Aneurinibacillus thermoaerophilus]QYY44361.1 helical backbone metal receptor [Aneurinibacillus thermoaerophilus]
MENKTVIDHAERAVTFHFPPQRIVSLCPSLTDTLFALGLKEKIVGRTQFCIHPAEQVKNVRRVGGTKQIKMDVIKELQPDLIIAEKEENPKEMVEALAERYPVYVTDVENYTDALRMIRDLGQITGTEDAAQHIITRIETNFASLKPTRDVRVAYLIWQKPYMAAGNHTYIHSLLEKCGFVNVFRDFPGRYPTVMEADLREEAPDFIFLSSEPFPFKETHRNVFHEQFPDSVPLLVDGEMFSWYGVRMIKAALYFNTLIHTIEQQRK